MKKAIIVLLMMVSGSAIALDLELGIGIPFTMTGLGTDIRDSKGELWSPGKHKIGYLGLIWKAPYNSEICICHYSVIEDIKDAGVTVLVVKKRFKIF